MQNHVIDVKVAVLRGEQRVVWLIGTITFHGNLHSQILYKKLMDEMVRELYDAARIRAQINPVYPDKLLPQGTYHN